MMKHIWTILIVLMLTTLFNNSSDGLFMSDNILITNNVSKVYQVIPIENGEYVISKPYSLTEKLYFEDSEVVLPKVNIKLLNNLNYVETIIPKDNYSHNANYTCNTINIRYTFFDRSITMNSIVDICFMMSNFAYTNDNSILGILYVYEFDLSHYNLRISWLYLGKFLTRSKYSSVTIANAVRKPKSSLLIILLLFICGDTGVAINPGPVGLSNEHVDDDINYGRYLCDFDPDSNYFNETELNSLNFKSYTINEFNDEKICGPNSFNIMHHNCRSILSKGKLDEYDYFIDMLGDPFDIIGLTETWLNEKNVNSPIFKDYNYNHVYKTRPLDKDSEMKDRGGGISLFIRNHIPFKVRDDLSVLTPYLELLFVEIDLDNKKYLIGVAYRIPNEKMEFFTEGINAILEKNKEYLSSHSDG